VGAFRRRQGGLFERPWNLPCEAFERSAWHGGLGRDMRLIDHVEFVYLHEDYHLSRVREIAHVWRGAL